MTILHITTIPDHGKAEHGVYITDLQCHECGKQLEAGDAFTIREDGYKERNEFVPCNIFNDKDCDEKG